MTSDVIANCKLQIEKCKLQINGRGETASVMCDRTSLRLHEFAVVGRLRFRRAAQVTFSFFYGGAVRVSLIFTPISMFAPTPS